jgi:hypothetical protein
MLAATITVAGKQLGSRKPLFPDQGFPYPPDYQRSSGRTTLRDLITRIVLEEIAAFRQRAEERRLLRALTATEIARGVETGKIDSGGRELDQNVDEDTAITTALQAFEDGLYYVFIDNKQYQELDAPIVVGPTSTVTFIRLVALAGG